MKHIFLIVWCAIIMASNYKGGNIDFTSLQQLEMAYVLSGLYFLRKCLKDTEFNFLLGSLSIYYTWVAITDQFIENMPNFVVNFESVFFCAIISIGLIVREK